jgi:glycosyltransferase involved in cell wall biosynthesis
MPSMIDFSICIPTYNSEKTLRDTLVSIKNQDIDKNRIEVLIFDGGSTDDTIKIAKEYPFVKILKNEKRLPEFAKLQAINVAKGKYYIMMDSDEAFSHNSVLSNRLNAFNNFRSAHLLVANKLNYVKGFGIAGNYLNKCGDPFTWFVYKNKHGILESFKSNIKDFIVDGDTKINLLSFKPEDKKPIADGGTTTYDLDFFKNHYKDQLNDIKMVTAMADNIFAVSNECLCIENDNVLHRSKSQLNIYLKKIKFRIINNIFAPSEAGFSSRNIAKTNRKYLFPLYAVSFIFPLIDSIKLSIIYHDATMMLHILYTYYTTILIAYYMLLKILGIKKSNKEY